MSAATLLSLRERERALTVELRAVQAEIARCRPRGKIARAARAAAIRSDLAAITLATSAVTKIPTAQITDRDRRMGASYARHLAWTVARRVTTASTVEIARLFSQMHEWDHSSVVTATREIEVLALEVPAVLADLGAIVTAVQAGGDE